MKRSLARVLAVLDAGPPGQSSCLDPAYIHAPTPDSILDPERASRSFSRSAPWVQTFDTSGILTLSEPSTMPDKSPRTVTTTGLSPRYGAGA